MVMLHKDQPVRSSFAITLRSALLRHLEIEEMLLIIPGLFEVSQTEIIKNYLYAGVVYHNLLQKLPWSL